MDEIRDSIEFYNGQKCIASVRSTMVPTVNSFISIRGKAWRVISVTYALDHADNWMLRAMRANVDVKRHK